MRFLHFLGPLQLKYGIATIASLAGAFAATNKDMNPDELIRPLQFWRQIFPIYLDYKFHEYLFEYTGKEPDFSWLHRKHAPRVLAILSDLKGIYVKIGQVISQRPDYCPKEYRDVLKVLLDNVPGAIDGAEAREIVRESLGQPIDSVFEYFNDEAIGSASIAQVHYARLIDGREVVVKLQLPLTKKMFKTDISTMNSFTRFALPGQVLLAEEFEKQFLLEFDFERECWAIETIRENMKGVKNVIVPAPIKEFTRPNLLIMDYVPGIKLVDAVHQQGKYMALRLGCSSIAEFQNKLYNPTWSFQFKFYGLIFFNLAIFKVKRLFNYLFGRFYTIPSSNFNFDIFQIYDTLLEAHGKQFLIDGLFNGDPHPGNCLVTDKGELGLIDFGQVKMVSDLDRYYAAKLLVLLNEGDSKKEEVVNIANLVGFSTVNNSPDIIYKGCVLAFDRDDLEMTEGIGLTGYVEKMARIDATKSIPDQYIMAVRMMVMLRGLASIMFGPFYPPVSISQRWLHFAKVVVENYERKL